MARPASLSWVPRRVWRPAPAPSRAATPALAPLRVRGSSLARARTLAATLLGAAAWTMALPAAGQAADAPTVSVANPATGAVWGEGRILNVAASDPDGLTAARFVLKHLASATVVLDRTVAIPGTPTQVGGPNNPVGTAWDPATTSAPDGRYEVTMRVTDATGATGEARREFFFDTTAPTVTFTTAPAAVPPGAAVTWAFAADDGPAGSGVAATQCRLGAGTWGACPNGDHFTATGLSVGEHRLDVKATDGGGHETIATRVVVVDGTPPTATITGGLPDGAKIETLDAAVWSFASNETGSFACRVARVDDEAAAWGPCRLATSHRPGDVTPGVYLFQVRALDLAGNASEPAGRTFTFAPAAGAPGGPHAQPTAASRVEFRFSYVLRARGRNVVVSDLRVTKLSTGATLAATCKGKRCPTSVKPKRRGTRWRLSGLIGRALPRGTEIVISATKPGAIGKYVRLKLAAPGKPPKVTERCLAPGGKTPTRCPTS